MRRTLIALFAVVLASSVALGPQARAASDDNAQINALYQQFTTAFRNKDVDAVMSAIPVARGLITPSGARTS